MNASRFALMLCVVLLISYPIQSPATILWSAAWSPDGSQLAIGGENTLWILEGTSFEKRDLVPDQKKGFTVTGVAWDPSGKILAATDQKGQVTGLYEIRTGKHIPLDSDGARGVAWSPDGNRLAITSAGDGHLRIWSKTGSLLQNHPRHKDAKGLTGVSWSPSGKQILTIGKYITMRQANGTPLKQITHRPEARERLNLLLGVAWNPTGKIFAIGDYGNEEDDPVLQLWSSTGKLVNSIRMKGGAEIRNVSWNQDGTLLASASDALRVWNRKGELIHEGQSPDLLWGVDWHPDGTRIITSSIRGGVTLWDAKAKVLRQIIEPAP